MIKSLSPRPNRALSPETRDPGQQNDSRDHDRRPSPSLVPLPAHVTGQFIKDRLPLMKYGEFLERKAAGGVEVWGVKQDDVCIVCMGGLDAGDEVREQQNCSHICHRECLDAWIERDHDACPLCRAKLLPAGDDKREREDGGEYDPWRAERMVYLFGEGCYF